MVRGKTQLAGPQTEIDMNPQVIIMTVKSVRRMQCPRIACPYREETMTRLTAHRKSLLTNLMKDAVYDATVQVLTSHGADGLTMERVAVAAGMAKGNLYNYFDSKLSLLQFVYERAYEPIRQGLDRITATAVPAADKLESIARMYFEYVGEHRGLFRFLLNDDSVRGLLKSEQEGLRAKVRAELTAIVRQGVQQGHLRVLDAALVAEMLLGVVRQLAERQLATQEIRPVDETVGGLMQVFLHGIVTDRQVP